MAEEYFTSGRMRKEDVVMAEEYFTSGWRREEEGGGGGVAEGKNCWQQGLADRERERERGREGDRFGGKLLL